MAKDKKKKQAAEDAVEAPVKKAKKKGTFIMGPFLIMVLLMALLFLPTTLLLFAGMLPSVAAFMVDKHRKKATALSVAALNLVGCSPFLFELWRSGNTVQEALDIVSDPMVIIVMYSAAGVGYVIDWVVSSIAGSFLFQRDELRIKFIESRQKELVERWGHEVKGEVKLDNEGFPLE